LGNLNDRDIAYDLLYGCKSGAQAYMASLLESATPRCREVMHRLHDDCLRDQWRVWQFLHQRSEYRVDEATRQELDAARSRMEHLARSHDSGPALAGRGAAEGGWGGTGRWEPGRWNAREEDARNREMAPLGSGFADAGSDAGRNAWGYDANRRAQPATHRY
jgi:hypothetical protein